MYYCIPKNIACPFANFSGYCTLTACSRQFNNEQKSSNEIIIEIYQKLNEINNLLKELENCL